MAYNFPEEDLGKKFEEELKAAKANVKSPNILLVGQTGVGKSSLINVIFGDNLAAVSDIKPETRGFHTYSTPNVPVNIIDSEGYELKDSELFRKSLDNFIDSNFADVTKQIHIAWYCMNVSTERVLPYDVANINYIIGKHIPLCVVLTQCDLDTIYGDKAKAMISVVEREFQGKIQCFQVCNDREINKELDVDKLIDWSINNIDDENIRAGFVIAQKASLKIKEEQVQNKIKIYAGEAAAIAASPIPMSDAVLLTALQTKMAADIFTIYGISYGLSDIALDVIKGKVVSNLAKALIGNILKFFPGANAAGIAINMAVASSITYSMGYALNKLCKMFILNILEGDGNSTELLKEIFTPENLDKAFDEYKKNNENE